MLILKTAALLAASAFAVPGCDVDMVVIDNGHVTVTATGVSRQGRGAVSIGGLHAKTPPRGPKISEVEVTFYRDVDGVPGYDNPPDRYVGHKAASAGTPTSAVTIGSMSTSSAQNGTADSWQVRVVDENGTPTTASGSF